MMAAGWDGDAVTPARPASVTLDDVNQTARSRVLIVERPMNPRHIALPLLVLVFAVSASHCQLMATDEPAANAKIASARQLCPEAGTEGRAPAIVASAMAPASVLARELVDDLAALVAGVVDEHRRLLDVVQVLADALRDALRQLQGLGLVPGKQHPDSGAATLPALGGRQPLGPDTDAPPRAVGHHRAALLHL